MGRFLGWVIFIGAVAFIVLSLIGSCAPKGQVKAGPVSIAVNNGDNPTAAPASGAQPASASAQQAQAAPPRAIPPQPPAPANAASSCGSPIVSGDRKSWSGKITVPNGCVAVVDTSVFNGNGGGSVVVYKPGDYTVSLTSGKVFFTTAADCVTAADRAMLDYRTGSGGSDPGWIDRNGC